MQGRRGGLRLAGLIATACLWLMGSPLPAAADGGFKSVIDQLGGKACENIPFTCVDLAVPVDRSKPGSNETLTIRFAVSFAKQQSKGILFYVVGGPGGSGIESIEGYLAAFGPRLTNEMDIVFFDQRGVGALNGIVCTKANLAFDIADLSLDKPEATIDAARTFVKDCLAETPNGALLPYVATDVAVQDLEDFRAAIGSPKVWLYGESYGTQFAQTYATRYPQALNGLILDGVVDLTLNAEQYYGENIRTVEKLLEKVLAGCDAEASCRADMGGPAAKAYDALAAKLKAGPIMVDFPLATGGFVQRELTTDLLMFNAFYALYGPDVRVAFLRALTAAANDNFVPMLRLGYSNYVADGEPLQPVADPSWYGAAYYAITCADYDDAGKDPEARAREIIEQARKLAEEAPRTVRSGYAERLACAFWPSPGATSSTAAFVGGDYPTLLLNSDSDPATPVSNGLAVFKNVKNASMITMQGGPHVIWGRGLDCPDVTVDALMLDGKKPAQAEEVCSQDFLDPYVPLTKVEAGDLPGLTKALQAELGQLPEVANWDGSTPLALGCDFGGTVSVTAEDDGTAYAFKSCALWPNLAVSGKGIETENAEGESALTLDVTTAQP